MHDLDTKVSFVYDVRGGQDGPVGGGRVIERGVYVEVDGTRRDDGVAEVYDGNWTVLEPNMVLDPEGRGTVWEVKVGLRGLERGMELRKCMGVMSRRRGRAQEARGVMLDRLREAVEEGDKTRWTEWWEEWAWVYALAGGGDGDKARKKNGVR